MRNLNILYYGKVKSVDVYESMFEYVKTNGTADYEIDYVEGQPEYFVEEWQVALDSEICFGYDPLKDAGEIEIDGQDYTRIGKEITELSYVPTDSLSDTLYIIYRCNSNTRKCNCTDEIFQTKEEAEKRANGLIRKNSC